MERQMMHNFDPQAHIFRSPELKSIVDDAVVFFNETPVHPLPPQHRFNGAGVYALYYHGGFAPYAPLAVLNSEASVQPIYVGKAVAQGWRTARIKTSTAPDLHNRLRGHSRSLDQVENLMLEDFQCRFMILDGIEGDLVVPVEAELIRRYKPL